ncbi:unnamed protein product, partial [Bubo scandiacus]
VFRREGSPCPPRLQAPAPGRWLDLGGAPCAGRGSSPMCRRQATEHAVLLAILADALQGLYGDMHWL